MDRLIIRKDTYLDSVFLMAISAALGRSEALALGQVLLATPANKQLLQEQGFDPAELEGVGPMDLVVAIRAATASALDAAERHVFDLLSKRSPKQAQEASRPIGLDAALRTLPEANLALISVPGQYASYEARKALRAGLDVMIFSDNVSVEEEISLKDEATRIGRLVMGPDCGTAIIQGVMLGFANQVRRGSIGLIGASGTGMQEVSCLIDRYGLGVSQAIGTGGRDLSEQVQARTTLQAIDLLAADSATEVVVVISKPPSAQVAERVLSKLRRILKPSVVHFVGMMRDDEKEGVCFAPDLEAAAIQAAILAKRAPTLSRPLGSPERLQSESAGCLPEQRYLRGLFTGGTMAAEAVAYLRSKGFAVRSNLSHGATDHADRSQARGHEVVDLGDDEFTQGRPHPMIDPTPRVERLKAEADDKTVGVVVLDVVLGTGCHEDPAGAMLPAIEHVQHKARQRGGYLPVVASVTGTIADRQGRGRQVAVLERAGVVVLESNIAAVRFASLLLETMNHA